MMNGCRGHSVMDSCARSQGSVLALTSGGIRVRLAIEASKGEVMCTKDLISTMSKHRHNNTVKAVTRSLCTVLLSSCWLIITDKSSLRSFVFLLFIVAVFTHAVALR